MDESKKPSPPWWVRYGVPTVMAVWASVQCLTVQTQGLSSWRGGGFGMYGGFHPMQNEAWVQIDDDTPVRFWKKSKDDSELYKIVRPHLTFPRPSQLLASLKELSDESGKRYQVEITSPSLDLDTLTLSRHRLLLVSTKEQP